MSGDDVLTMPMARRIEVFTEQGRRPLGRADQGEDRGRELCLVGGEVAERYALCKNQLFGWRRDARRAVEKA